MEAFSLTHLFSQALPLRCHSFLDLQLSSALYLPRWAQRARHLEGKKSILASLEIRSSSIQLHSPDLIHIPLYVRHLPIHIALRDLHLIVVLLGSMVLSGLWAQLWGLLYVFWQNGGRSSNMPALSDSRWHTLYAVLQKSSSTSRFTQLISLGRVQMYAAWLLNLEEGLKHCPSWYDMKADSTAR